MSSANISVVANVLGQTVPISITRSESGAGLWTPSLAASPAGALTTRTSATAGVATLGDGHGIATSDVIDVFWDGGRRYGATATVSGDAVTFSGGGGDDLPAAATALVVAKEVAVNASFDPDDAIALLATPASRASIVFVDASDAVLLALDLAAGACSLWWSESGIAAPMSGNPVAKILVGNGSSALANIITVAAIYDATP